MKVRRGNDYGRTTILATSQMLQEKRRVPIGNSATELIIEIARAASATPSVPPPIDWILYQDESMYYKFSLDGQFSSFGYGIRELLKPRPHLQAHKAEWDKSVSMQHWQDDANKR
ncbi:hypothetical protein ACEQ8H_002907 [Pleosporales sp. CAS-2024a]